MSNAGAVDKEVTRRVSFSWDEVTMMLGQKAADQGRIPRGRIHVSCEACQDGIVLVVTKLE